MSQYYVAMFGSRDVFTNTFININDLFPTLIPLFLYSRATWPQYSSV